MSRIIKVCIQCGWCVAKCQDKENKIELCKVCNRPLIETGYFFGRRLTYHNGDGKAKLIEQEFNVTISDEMHQKRRDYYEAQLENSRQQRLQQQKAAADADYKAFLEKQKNAPKCPTCGSTNISSIGTVERAVSVGTVGLASGKIGKTRKCNNCGYMW